MISSVPNAGEIKDNVLPSRRRENACGCANLKSLLTFAEEYLATVRCDILVKRAYFYAKHR